MQNLKFYLQHGFAINYNTVKTQTLNNISPTFISLEEQKSFEIDKRNSNDSSDYSNNNIIHNKYNESNGAYATVLLMQKNFKKHMDSEVFYKTFCNTQEHAIVLLHSSEYDCWTIDDALLFDPPQRTSKDNYARREFSNLAKVVDKMSFNYVK